MVLTANEIHTILSTLLGTLASGPWGRDRMYSGRWVASDTCSSSSQSLRQEEENAVTPRGDYLNKFCTSRKKIILNQENLF